jgi:hypothetical protein
MIGMTKEKKVRSRICWNDILQRLFKKYIAKGVIFFERKT